VVNNMKSMDAEFLHSRRNQQIIAIASILSLVLVTLTFAPISNPQLSAFRRFLDPSASEANSSTNSINAVSRSPDFYAHNKFLELRPSSTIDVQSNSSLRLNEFTVSAWFRTSHFYFEAQEPTPYHFIVNKGSMGSENATKNMNYGIWMNDLDNIQGGFETETGIDHFVKARDIRYNDGKWHYAALTYDGNLLSLYIDGILKDITITDNAKPDSTTTHPLSIGVKSNAKTGFFLGSVDEINIWNRQLGDEELKALLESGAHSNKGLVFHMSFD
jgi:hypothetical protein